MELDLECYCVKGIGRVHAKWSPVCTAYYRLINKINILEEINGDDAEELKQLCPKGVFVINKKGNAEVGNVRDCTSCRECISQKVYFLGLLMSSKRKLKLGMNYLKKKQKSRNKKLIKNKIFKINKYYYKENYF